MSRKKPIAVELFSGAGGLSLGLEQSGFDIVLANEKEPDFAQTFKLNHPDTTMLCKDIYKVDFSKELHRLNISEVDLVSGGPPCQGFSTVGSKNKGDTRNSLFHEYLRAVTEVDPNYVLFENVSGFKKMYEGEAHRTLLSELHHLGYACRSAVLDASDYGLPQVRQRTMIVGWKKTSPEVRFPKPTHFDGPNLLGLPEKLTLMDAISDLPELGTHDSRSHYKCPPQNGYQKELRGQTSVLTEHHSANYGRKMQEILSLIPEGGDVHHLPERLRPGNYFGNTYARLHPDRPAPTITRNFGTPSSSRCIHPFQNRALSTREGARLQGFPDRYQFYGSKTSKNLQIGNAVPPVLAQVIADEILRSISKAPLRQTSERKQTLDPEDSAKQSAPSLCQTFDKLYTSFAGG